MQETIGIKVKKIREFKNISQKYVSEKLGISQAAYSDIENGKTKLNEQKLNQIATILEVEPEIIKNFSEAVIFNSCKQSGYYNVNHINSTDRITTLYEGLLAEKNEQIAILKALIEQLKK
jgi:transcriptional regulator with XRE-family HTH domain